MFTKNNSTGYLTCKSWRATHHGMFPGRFSMRWPLFHLIMPGMVSHDGYPLPSSYPFMCVPYTKELFDFSECRTVITKHLSSIDYFLFVYIFRKLGSVLPAVDPSSFSIVPGSSPLHLSRTVTKKWIISLGWCMCTFPVQSSGVYKRWFFSGFIFFHLSDWCFGNNRMSQQ